MGSGQEKKMIVGLDIGTSKVVAIVGELCGDGQIEVVGIGSNPSRGMKKGVVVNIESTVQSIQRAIEEAELMESQVATFAVLILTVSWPFVTRKFTALIWSE